MVAVVVDGSPVLLAVPAVLVAAVQVAAVVHPEQVALPEQMALAAAAAVDLLEPPRRAPVDLELSLFATQYQTFQHPISILPTTLAPTQTTSLQQPP